MRKGFLIYEEMSKYFPIYSMRLPLVIYDFADSILNFLIYEENLIFFFISILFYISGGERGQGDGRPLHVLSHN